MKKIILFFIVLGSFVISALGQSINLRSPQGTYFFTDTNGEKYKLIIKPYDDSLLGRGKAEIISISNLQNIYYCYTVAFFDEHLLICPSEKTPLEYDDLYITTDGWIYPSRDRAQAGNPKERIKLTKASTNKGSSASSKKRK